MDACLNSSSNSDDWFVNEFSIHVNKFNETHTYRVQLLVISLGSKMEQCLGYASLNLPSDIPQIWNHPEGLCLTYENEGVRTKTTNEQLNWR